MQKLVDPLLQSQYKGIVLAALLALMVALISIQSSGISRIGDDGGSGMGGTGFTNGSDSSGSGFGGTGFQAFIGVDDSTPTNEVIIITRPSNIEPIASSANTLEAKIVAHQAPLQLPTSLRRSDQITQDSSALQISEVIQTDLQKQLEFYSNEGFIADNYFDEPQKIEINLEQSLQHTANEINLEISNAQDSSPNHRPDASANRNQWSVFEEYLNNRAEQLIGREEQTTASNPVELAGISKERRSALSKRIQRPQLPPLQRIRPIERMTVLPPRVLPMRL
ncbi:MAG: hypothetical protein COC19_08480 [SAR86 cluster bacterium]|uniref:Uncharacterized protein n=1 Tax=SAR86 cluster bacterium TaxID=2030880 RepID=A0A2A4MFE8_9GAMM|nr:MAG: hypothetical protein COC19_08480 [SAR86 cluster bacterium]